MEKGRVSPLKKPIIFFFFNLYTFFKDMLDEMDQINSSEQKAINLKRDVEEAREELEMKRQAMHDAAETELAEERAKMEEEKLRVQTLAQELQAAMGA